MAINAFDLSRFGIGQTRPRLPGFTPADQAIQLPPGPGGFTPSEPESRPLITPPSSVFGSFDKPVGFTPAPQPQGPGGFTPADQTGLPSSTHLAMGRFGGSQELPVTGDSFIDQIYDQARRLLPEVRKLKLRGNPDPSLYHAGTVMKILNNPSDMDPVDLINFLEYAIDQGAIDVYSPPLENSGGSEKNSILGNQR